MRRQADLNRDQQTIATGPVQLAGSHGEMIDGNLSTVPGPDLSFACSEHLADSTVDDEGSCLPDVRSQDLIPSYTLSSGAVKTCSVTAEDNLSVEEAAPSDVTLGLNDMKERPGIRRKRSERERHDGFKDNIADNENKRRSCVDCREDVDEQYDGDNSPDYEDKDYEDGSGTDDLITTETLPPIKRPRRNPARRNTARIPPSHARQIPPTEPEVSLTQDSNSNFSPSSPKPERIPISGFLTLQSHGSEVSYFLTFLPNPPTESCQARRPQNKAGRPSKRGRGTRGQKTSGDKSDQVTGRKCRPFSEKENSLLTKLKADGLRWDEIATQFPDRTVGTLQVHYSAKLKRRL